MKGKILKDPSPLSSPAEWRGEQKDEKILTAPLTFVLSRKGREEKEEKILRKPLTLPTTAGWRGLKKLRWRGTEGV